jgi:hypothetical protein
MGVNGDITHRALQHKVSPSSINSRVKATRENLVSQPENISVAFPCETFTGWIPAGIADKRIAHAFQGIQGKHVKITGRIELTSAALSFGAREFRSSLTRGRVVFEGSVDRSLAASAEHLPLT